MQEKEIMSHHVGDDTVDEKKVLDKTKHYLRSLLDISPKTKDSELEKQDPFDIFVNFYNSIKDDENLSIQEKMSRSIKYTVSQTKRNLSGNEELFMSNVYGIMDVSFRAMDLDSRIKNNETEGFYRKVENEIEVMKADAKIQSEFVERKIQEFSVRDKAREAEMMEMKKQLRDDTRQMHAVKTEVNKSLSDLVQYKSCVADLSRLKSTYSEMKEYRAISNGQIAADLHNLNKKYTDLDKKITDDVTKIETPLVHDEGKVRHFSLMRNRRREVGAQCKLQSHVGCPYELQWVVLTS
ncbi:hypothetical protein QAD02_002672 [Eretmocerus hayati]|uniref:Uncharacterized protein n=1 Tax=Eretmocerus hayati TaxID=131215 RepID=A0ACC2NKI8_9HYME|nr:hypothetical protein QAD02_002672 [Eretmocerus hayati]